MDGLRDLVNSQACDDGSGRGYRNPLGKLVDHVYRDRSQREQQEWQEFPQDQLNSQHERGLSTQTSMEGHAQPFLHNGFQNEFGFPQPQTINPLGVNLDYDEFDSFMKNEPNFGEQGPHPFFEKMGQISDEVPQDLLKEYIKSFIDASRSQETFRPMVMPDFGLSDMDKMKIKNRSEVLARQIYGTQNDQYVDKQVASFLSSFGPQTGRTVGRYDKGKEWADEFGEQHNMKEEEMEHIFRDAQRAQPWVNEFEHFEKEGKLEEVWDEVQNTQNWVDEFEGVRPIDSLEGRDLRDITKSITQINDPKLQSTNFMKFMESISNGKVKLENGTVRDATKEEMDGDRWASEFDEDRAQYGETWDQEFLREDADDMVNEFSQFTDEQEWIRQFNHFYVPNNEYQFGDPAENPYMEHPNPFQKGMKLFQEGKIGESILAFEAELHKTPDNAECWKYLGIAHAENDKDGKAINALVRATTLEPENTNAMLALAVSYTNEMFRDEALDTLKSWLEKSPEYSHIKVHAPDFRMGYNFKQYHSVIADAFIEAAQLRGDNIDPDVQTALGLLFNLNMDYDKAVDCFKAALTARPDDYQLWNKLGATLANSNHSDEALGCYYEALRIKPSYVRARANLGISYMALKDYFKAATYFLGALEMHPDAKHIWTNLQMVFMSMDRPDLIDKASEGRTDVFKEEFEF